MFPFVLMGLALAGYFWWKKEHPESTLSDQALQKPYALPPPLPPLPPPPLPPLPPPPLPKPVLFAPAISSAALGTSGPASPSGASSSALSSLVPGSFSSAPSPLNVAYNRGVVDGANDGGAAPKGVSAPPLPPAFHPTDITDPDQIAQYQSGYGVGFANAQSGKP